MESKNNYKWHKQSLVSSFEALFINLFFLLNSFYKKNVIQGKII